MFVGEAFRLPIVLRRFGGRGNPSPTSIELRKPPNLEGTTSSASRAKRNDIFINGGSKLPPYDQNIKYHTNL